jgi:dimethylaniline monooxygenase (N-oxide forming)
MATPTIAIIGCGVTGLATLKNLLEAGFTCTAFDSRPSIGGIWKFTSSPSDNSVLETTISNKSRYKNCFTDFPYPEDAPPFPDARGVQEYLEAYARKFDLMRHVKLSTKVVKVVRNETEGTWSVHLRQNEGTETQEDFDKIAVCRGEWGEPKMPFFEGRDVFNGEIIHSLAFKHPSQYASKRVVVLGLGNNAADISTTLAKHAKSVYLAHRRGANLLPRFIDGKPGDLAVTLRLNNLKYALNAISPALAELFFNFVMRSLTNKAFKLKPEWRIHPAPSIFTHQPTVTDDLVDCLAEGRIVSKPNIRRFTGPRSIEFIDGTFVDNIDAVICCTGFIRDFSLVPDMLPIVFSDKSNEEWTSHPNSDGKPLAHLYLNIFPLRQAESVAYLNNFSYPTGYTPIADLASMAVAQVWRGTSSLPSISAMQDQIRSQHAWLVKQLGNGTVASDFVQEEHWLRAMHDLAGTGRNEMLGYRMSGWKWWASDPGFAGLVMGGVESPHAMRLFEGKRKRWEGARKAIEDVNKQVDRLEKGVKCE